MSVIKTIVRTAGTTLAASALMIGATTAWADDIYNTLDSTVDAAHESMNLLTGGAAGTTTLQLQIAGREAEDHPGCNLKGAPHFVQLEATSSDPLVATVAFANGVDKFYDCTDTLTVAVTPLTVGTTTISFRQIDQNLSNDPKLIFSYTQAAFDVVVRDGSTGGNPTACDANPAAPAWAAALLKASGYKARTTVDNYVAKVAAHMAPTATFDGVVKNADNLAYANAVRTYMESSLQITGLKSVERAAKPGWVCTTI